MKVLTEFPVPIASLAVPDGEGLDVSVIVPVTERPEALAPLYEEFSAPLRATERSYEFIFVAGQWSPDAKDVVLDLIRRGEPVQVLEIGQNLGEAALIRTAAAHCSGRTVLTLPAYYRVEATTLPELVEGVQAGADLVVARRWPRRDSWINQLQNRVLHGLISGLTRDRIHDVACGVRAMRRDFLMELPVYGDFFRFLPLLAMREGYRVEELNAPQHPRDVGARVYAPGVYLRRLIDIFGLFFLLRFTEKPLRFFGMVGSILSLVGTVILGIGVVQRLFGDQGLADRPLLLFGVLLLVLGVQAVALGLIGEIIVHLQARRTPTYRVRTREGREG